MPQENLPFLQCGRALEADWVAGWQPRLLAAGDWVLRVSGDLVLKPANGWLQPVVADEVAALSASAVSLGELRGRPLFVVNQTEGALAGLQPLLLRDLILHTENAPVAMISTAVQLARWWRDHRFCGRCGTTTVFYPRERARWCQNCEIPWYPRVAPCVIVVIRRGERMLLARSSRTRRPTYSLIAGFVEPGESLEQAVAREVKEETGLQVSNVRYRLSQPWPFPHQLMAGFFADYESGELVLQQDELADAGWFVPGHTPPIPPLTTISGQLIHDMAEEILADIAGRANW
ncbi:MAG TPA: NAD(+) diphosphatase [Marinobacter sp.]|nr:NAD(+) diphosphatase [Marinobacter sp.]